MPYSKSSRTLLAISQILVKYQWLINSYNLDYYLEDHWNKIPPKWTECLNQLDVFDIPWLLDSSSKQKIKHIFPLSFLCLRSLSSIVRMIRSRTCNHKIPFSSQNQIQFNQRYKFSENLSTTLDHILTRGIKLKKRHEIQQLCKLISSVMQKFENNLEIIDFGSGKCHLSRILSLCYGYRVFCVEGKSENISGALKRENKVLDALKKYKRFEVRNEEMPVKVNRFLTKKDDVNQIFNGKITRPHLLLGLHACGSLSNLILEEFVNNPNSHCLILVCCCYMNSEMFWFPMSKILKENLSFTLSIAAKELACHAIEKFLNKFSQKELDSLKVHGYRACLEVLIEKYAPERRHQSMKNVKILPNMTFKEYIAKATKDFNLAIPKNVFESDLVKDFISQTDRVIMFYSLRLLIAPLVELFILLDYKEYLSEQNQVKHVYLFPLFEPSISPRNFILVAHK